MGLGKGDIAILDLDNHTALHLEAIHPLPLESETLLDFNARIFGERAQELKKLSDVVVVDGYFSKEPFVSGLTHCGLDVISRFQDDVRLRYIIQTQNTGKQGRPKTNGEPVTLSNLDMKHFALEKGNDDLRLYTAVVHALALKRTVRVVFVEFLKQGKITSSKVDFSTNIEMEATEILEMYHMLFQTEFVYRDAKQHTSLTSCQARNKKNWMCISIFLSLL
jgi:hypothetical protein